jgi:hypothetical protein
MLINLFSNTIFLTDLKVISEKDVYGIPKGTCFTLPCVFKGNFEYQVVEDLELQGWVQDSIQEGVKELKWEMEEAF